MTTTKETALNNEILRGVVGSTALGTALEGTDDRDEMGVFIEPARNVCGLTPCDHYIYRDKPEGVRSEAGDLALTIYSLRKYCRLAAQGNPSVLLLLWLPEYLVQTPLGADLVAGRQVFVSREAGQRFLGYLVSQRMKLKGEKAHTVNRPELIEKYGYDCYSDDTEFLTKSGWRVYDEIPDRTPLGTVSPTTKAIEFQTPSERLAKPYSGEMLEFRHRYMNCLVTPNHRMYVSPVNRGPSGAFGTKYVQERANWQFMTAENALQSDWLHVQVSNGSNSNVDYAVSDSYLALVGVYLSEGCVSKRLKTGAPSVLAFTQNVGGRAEPVLEMVANSYPLRTYSYPPRDGRQASTIYTLANREIADRISSECGNGSSAKRLPEWALSLSRRQAKLLLEALIAGDGTHRKDYRIYYTISPRLAGDVQALAVICGYRSNVWGPYQGGMFQVFIQEGCEFQAISTRVNVVRHAPKDRRIVCFTVPNETLVTRRNGKIAMHGNTKFAMHALRLGLQGIEMMQTRNLVLPIPEPDRSTLMAIRTGKLNYNEALALIDGTETKLRALVEDFPVKNADFEAINDFMVRAHTRHW